MAVSPDLYSDWRIAKRAAAVLANACGAVLLQDDKGKPRVVMGRAAPRSFPTWLAAWSFLFRIRADQIKDGQRKPDGTEAPPMARIVTVDARGRILD